MGSMKIDGTDIDFYFCVRPNNSLETASLLFRDGDEPPDYGSTTLGYVTPISMFQVIAFALFLKYHKVNGANESRCSGTFFSNGVKVLDL
jgi:hypothetical protein